LGWEGWDILNNKGRKGSEGEVLVVGCWQWAVTVTVSEILFAPQRIAGCRWLKKHVHKSGNQPNGFSSFY
jgi:hypothetical protein